MAELVGEIQIEDKAKKIYNQWYEPFYKSLKGKGDKSGILSRLHMGVFKLSIILAANDMETSIMAHHMEMAIEECMKLIPNYNSFIMTSGTSTVSQAGALFFEEIQQTEKYCISRKAFLQKHWTAVDSDMFDKLVITLETGGLIQSIMNGADVFYQLTEKAKDVMKARGQGAGT